MSRNNSSKIGDISTDSTPKDAPAVDAVVSRDPKDSGVSYIAPTEHVTLPSHGLYYPEGHDLCGIDSIEIKQMTAKEEDILTNASYIKNGTVLDKLMRSIVVDNIDLDGLTIGDKNAILIAARASAYGSDYEATATCPSCSAKQQINIDLNEVLDVSPPDFESLPDGCEFDKERKTLKVVLPRTRLQFELRPRIGADDAVLQQKKRKLKKLKLKDNSSSMIESFSQITVGIDGNTDHHFIKKTIENLPAFDFRYLRNCYQDNMPDVNMHTFLECSTCGAEEVISVPMSADFLWPDIRVSKRGI